MMNTTVRLLVLLGLVAACSSPAASPSPTTAPTPTVAAVTPSPVASPNSTAQAMADALTKAFAAKDADAVGRLLAPQIAIGTVAVLEPVQPGDRACCILAPSVASFVNELRGQFASGALTVTVDPKLQPPAVDNAPDSFVVTSDWREADRTTRIDLSLRDTGRGNGWLWMGALHHYQKADIKGVCLVKYRPPWVPTGTVTNGC